MFIRGFVGFALTLLTLAGVSSERAVAQETVRLDVTRDTWVSAYHDGKNDERDANLGGAGQLKTKGIQEMILLDVGRGDDDSPMQGLPATLAGRAIRGVTLHVQKRGAEPQLRLTVSTLATPWTEGTSGRYATQKSSASFNWARQETLPWAYPGSDLTAAALGQGHTLWSSANASTADKQGWQQVTVDPRIMAARLTGLSHGFVIVDDIGSEYSVENGKFNYRLFPNRYVQSREAGRGRGPYFTVELGPVDRSPPGAVTQLQADRGTGVLPPGEALVTWRTPADVGPAGTLGFDVRWCKGAAFDAGKAQTLPRYLIPLAGKTGETVSLRVRDLSLKPGEVITLALRAVDATGNVGPMTTLVVPTSAAQPIALPEVEVQPFTEVAPLPTLDGLKLAVIDALDKARPVTGEIIPTQPAAYRAANHVWSAKEKRIRLYAARNEFVAFQLLAEGKAKGVDVSLSFDETQPALATKGDANDTQPRASWFRFRYVNTSAGPLPDPLIPVAGRFDFPAGDEAIDGQRFSSLLAEVYVPHHAIPGLHKGTLTLRHAGQTLTLAVELYVHDFALPDQLTFIPQMNCYGLPGPPAELSYYRLAHEHRTCLNRLPYNWRGQTHDLAPRWDGKSFDWRDYDQRFGPLLDGTAFADLPRAGVPVDAFYLPINESWPMNLAAGFRGGYWADDALTDDYRKQLVTASRLLAEHFTQRGWRGTQFEFYLNNKVYFRKESLDRTTAWWVFDEPVNTQDFVALRWFGQAFHEGVSLTRTPANAHENAGPRMAFRGDISRPQWQRGLLDEVLDVNVVGGSLRKYQRMIQERKERHRPGQMIYNYGSANAVEQSNVQPAAWCLDAWTLGADGVIPWQTIGNDKSWRQGDALSLFYPGKAIGQDGPIASVRLKAFARGQQDVEYLNLLLAKTGGQRWMLGDAVRQVIGTENSGDAANADIAAAPVYDRLTPQALWALRLRVARALQH